MTNPVLDGWLVLQHDLTAVLATVACMLWGSVVVIAGLVSVVRKRLSTADYLSLAFGGWIVPVLASALLLVGVSKFVGARPSLPLMIALLALTGGLATWHVARRARQVQWTGLPVLALTAIFAALTLLSLAFVAGTPLPLYFDSATHYEIIQVVIQQYAGTGSADAAAWPVPGYYHVGYHILLAVLTWFSHANLADAMLASGQIVLASVPLSLFFIAHRETGSTLAGIFSVILGAVGWYMPAFAVNWGKYPALFSLPAILFTLNVAYLARDGERPPAAARGLPVLAALGTGAAFFIHTRSLAVLALMLCASAIAAAWTRRPLVQRMVLFAVAIVGLMVEALLISRNQVLASTLNPYLGRGLAITVLVALLAAPAFRAYPWLSFSALLTIVFFLGALFVPIPGIAATTLLDRPFVEMLVFIPMTLIGAAGSAAVLQYVASRGAVATVGATVVLSLAILVHAFARYDFYPSTCCSMVQEQDLVALDWLSAHLPAEAQVAISTADLRFVPPPYPSEFAPTDAGAWISALTGRQASRLPFWTDFTSPSTLELLCARGVTDIYLGGQQQSFEAGSLNAKREWYTIILNLPGATLYRVIGCPP